MRITPITLSLLACLSAAAADTVIADKTTTIDVTGQKQRDQSTLTQPDLATAREDIERTPGGANIVDAANYRTGRVATLADSLGYAPGVFVQPRFGAEETRVSIRGSGLQRTFHGRGLKLMQDGVPMNLADGSFDFQAIEALTARYIQVWRGANALQYGAANLGGAINYVSPNGLNSPTLQARAEAGSFGYRRLQAGTGGLNDSADWYFSASDFKQDGFRRHAEQHTQRLFANIGWRFDRDFETRFYVGYADSDSFLPGSVTKAQMLADPRQANAANISGDQKRDVKWSRVSNKTVLRVGEQRFELAAFASDKTLFHPIFQVLDQDNRDYGGELRYINDGAIGGNKNRLTIGFAPSRNTTQEDRWVNVGGKRGARTNKGEQTSTNTEFYIEDQFGVSESLSLVAGAQSLRATRKLDDLFIAGTASDKVSESFDRSYTAFNPKLGALYALDKTTQLYANLSRSAEPPSMSEIVGGLYPVLTNIQKATTLEFGGRGRSGTLEWDVSAYRSAMRDELLQIATNVVGANITVNAPRTIHQGIEAFVAGKADGFEWRAAGLYNDFRFDGDAKYGNNKLPGVPSVFLRAEAGYRLGNGLGFTVNMESAPRDYAIDFARSYFADGYTIYGIKLNQTVSKSLSWFLEGRNLGDKHYASATGVVRDAGGKDTAQFLPGDGRSVYAGLEWRL